MTRNPQSKPHVSAEKNEMNSNVNTPPASQQTRDWQAEVEADKAKTIAERAKQARRRATAPFTNKAAAERFVKEARASVGGGEDYEYFLVSGHLSEGLSESEHQECRNLVAVLRGGGWFGGWLEDKLHLAAVGHQPTPQQMMADLVEVARDFADKVRDARQLMHQYPELVGVLTDFYQGEDDEG